MVNATSACCPTGWPGDLPGLLKVILIIAAGNPLKLYGLNSVGLERRGFSDEVRKALKKTYRILFQSGHNVSQGLAQAEKEAPAIPEVKHLLNFIKDSERGITV